MRKYMAGGSALEKRRHEGNEKIKTSFESHLLDYSIFRWYGSYWKSVFYSVYRREDSRMLKIVNNKEDFTMEKYTIDELLDVLQWARDRAAYFRACNKPMPGALYAADCKAERDAEAELYRRGYYTA